MKAVARSEARLTNDPRQYERLIWQRIRELVEREAVHRDWGCALYTLHRLGRIGNDQREAGDRYVRLILDWRKLWHDPMGKIEVYRTPGHEHLEKRSPLTADAERMLAVVVADAKREESEFEIKRAKRLGDRYKEARIIAGLVNSVLEAMLIDEIWPAGEAEHRNIADALTRLSHFFNTGTNRQRRK